MSEEPAPATAPSTAGSPAGPTSLAGPTTGPERVVVALSGSPAASAVLDRAVWLAARLDAPLLGVHVRPVGQAGVTGELERQRRTLEGHGGRLVEVSSDEPATALITAARSLGATQLVVGSPGQPHSGPFRRPVLAQLLTLPTGFELHVVPSAGPAPPETARARRRTTTLPALSWRREAAGWLVVTAGVSALTLVVLALSSAPDLTVVLLAYLVVVLLAALIGGRRPGVAAALVAFAAANWFFTPPRHTFRVAKGDDVASLVVFFLVALTVAALEDRVARREREARNANVGAETLARATAALAAPDPLPELCSVLCVVFGIPACAVVEPAGPGASDPAAGQEAAAQEAAARWRVLASAGDDPPVEEGEGVTGFAIGHTGARLLARARLDGTTSGHILHAVADQLAVALERRELQARAAEAAVLAEADRLRVGLLRSVSHDLRSPLAAIKANVTALQRRDVEWDRAEVDDQLAAMDRECDRLNRLVGNLLDASRLQAGEVRLQLQPTALEDVIAAAVSDAGATPGTLQVDAEPTVPLALVDPELLTRAVANLISNALAWSPAGCPVRVEAAAAGNQVAVRVIDHGPGIRPELRERVLQPFQRLGDRSRDTGAGLGLAIASGFVTSMQGRLTLDDTPGGGLTATVTVPQATLAS